MLDSEVPVRRPNLVKTLGWSILRLPSTSFLSIGSTSFLRPGESAKLPDGTLGGGKGRGGRGRGCGFDDDRESYRRGDSNIDFVPNDFT